MNQQLATNLSVALESLAANKVRSLLTALGVIFGVAAVIAMMAIGRGTEQELLKQMELLGVNNIIVNPKYEEEENQELEEQVSKITPVKYTPGLTLQDMYSIQSTIPSVSGVSPEVMVEVPVIKSGKSLNGRLVGVTPAFFEIGSFALAEGQMFSEAQLRTGAQVCIIGNAVRSRLFSDADPIGKYLKCGPIWLKVIGVLQERVTSEKAISDFGLRDFNVDIYTPIQTVLIRYKNRARLGANSFAKGDRDDDEPRKKENYHQLDRLTIKVGETGQLMATADVVFRMLRRRHLEVEDFEVMVPEDKLKAQQKTQDMFQVVLLAIASISLLIGGIGIMNIMLASVLERIKEIGVRQSMGAKRKDIVLQFLLEAVMISVSGGLAGVALGLFLAYLISEFAEIDTVVSTASIFIAFGVSVFVGLLFGIIPAKRASEQNPITSLRYE